MITVLDRFLKYVSFDTQSVEDMENIPSCDKQFALGKELLKEMLEMGIVDARIDEHCYVYGSIPANVEGVPALGFIAHMDTAPDAPGANVKPRIVEKYDGGDIQLNENTVLSPKDFKELKNYVGQDIIVTDGTTLLGADDKAGVAEIMTLAYTLINNPEIKHGKILIAFTPDEEVGRGADMFDVKGFGADVAYTVDGGAIGEVEYENFNAASAVVKINGREIHPGDAKGVMVNSIHVGQEFDAMLPVAQRPEYTDGYEGFFHLLEIKGETASTTLTYIIRDHSMAEFEKKKELMRNACEFMNKKYGENTVELTLKDSYYNMTEKIEPHMYLINIAREAMKENGYEPVTKPIRGGTDGARLSFMGLPCPNLCAGGHNFHGRFEYVPVNSLFGITDILLTITKKFAELKK